MNTIDHYWAIQTDRASHRAFEEADPFRQNLLSIEGTESSVSGILAFAADHRLKFLDLLKKLSPERQEIAIEYILLRKTEKQIATLHGRKSQSMLGQELCSIVKAIGNAIRGLPAEPATRPCMRYRRMRSKVYRDPRLLGEFEISISHRRSDSLFTPRAGQVSNAAQI